MERAAASLALGLCCAFASAPAVFAMPTIHPGDKVDIVVFNHPELSSVVTVDGDGTVSLPVAGTVGAKGLSVDALAHRLEQRFAPYVKYVSVRVALESQSNTIFVAGGPSGVLSYQPGESLVSIVDRLQFTPTERTSPSENYVRDVSTYTEQVSAAPLDLFDGPVDYTRVTVLRDERTFGPYDVIALRSAGQPGLTLQPGDTIQLVNKPVAVSVTGDVAQPGTAHLNPTDPLSRAIDQVGGTTVTSTQVAITLVRAGTPQVVSLGSPLFSAPAVPGDRLIVPRAPRVDVIGTVVKPGETYLRGNQTLVSAIYYAGGPDRYANLKSVQVIRNGVKTEYDLAALRKGHDGINPPLQDGDVVFVPQGSTFDATIIFQAIASLGFVLYR
jgi:protein involved in polysaccharide export with SLBB domain